MPTLCVISFNEDVPEGGLVIYPDERLPLETKVLDNADNFYVTNDNKTITFLKKASIK